MQQSCIFNVCFVTMYFFCVITRHSLNFDYGCQLISYFVHKPLSTYDVKRFFQSPAHLLKHFARRNKKIFKSEKRMKEITKQINSFQYSRCLWPISCYGRECVWFCILDESRLLIHYSQWCIRICKKRILYRRILSYFIFQFFKSILPTYKTTSISLTNNIFSFVFYKIFDWNIISYRRTYYITMNNT